MFENIVFRLDLIYTDIIWKCLLLPLVSISFDMVFDQTGFLLPLLYASCILCCGHIQNGLFIRRKRKSAPIS